jgi:hypothetical protein
MPADRRLVPAARGQGVYLHVVLLCEHSSPGPSHHRQASEPMTVRGTPDKTAPRAGADGLRLVPTKLAYAVCPRAVLRSRRGGEFW